MYVLHTHLHASELMRSSPILDIIRPRALANDNSLYSEIMKELRKDFGHSSDDYI